MFVISAVASALTLVYTALWFGVADSSLMVMAGLVIVIDLAAIVVVILVTIGWARRYTGSLMFVLLGHFAFALGALVSMYAREGELADSVLLNVLGLVVGMVNMVLGPACFAVAAAYTAREQGSRAVWGLLLAAPFPLLSVGIFCWLCVQRWRKESVWNG